MAELLIVRHGESEWNASGRWQGQADAPLSAKGRDEARRAGAYLAKGALGRFGQIWASDLGRAFDTARLIAEALGNDVVSTHRGLRERSAGRWEGLTRPEIEQGWPGFLEQQKRPDGFEDDQTLLGRLLPAMDHIAATCDRAIAVAHGGVIRTLERNLEGVHGSIVNLASRLLVRDDTGWTIAEAHELAEGQDFGLE